MRFADEPAQCPFTRQVTRDADGAFWANQWANERFWARLTAKATLAKSTIWLIYRRFPDGPGWFRTSDLSRVKRSQSNLKKRKKRLK